MADILPIKEYALTLAADWLHRAVDSDNLVGRNVRSWYEDGEVGKRYLGGKADPLGAILAFDDARHA